jgi:uncharacterized protein YbbC (DUF1343 family)
MRNFIPFFCFLTQLVGCSPNNNSQQSAETQTTNPTENPPIAKITTGAEKLDLLLPELQGKNIALVVNYTALIGDTHLADTLKSRGVTIKKIMAPEHGFRGNAANGEHVKDGFDTKTGLQVLSLYGKNRKPTAEQLSDVDVVVYDIQDVGARFFTYISTLHYVMEACAENKKKLIVLDRPNPNGHYIDGPVLNPTFKSFVGMHPVPVVHGMTVGEFAQMINGEGWLENRVTCELKIIPLANWKHADRYSLPVRPSPNLPNDQAVRLYPSICFFEGTTLSLGRGTEFPFQAIGHPDLKSMPFQFTPVAIPGVAVNPPQENLLCFGLDLRSVDTVDKLDLHYLIDMYKAFPAKDKFFIPFFERLAGNAELRKQIQNGLTENEIRKSWQPDLDAYKAMRQKYLLYP